MTSKMNSDHDGGLAGCMEVANGAYYHEKRCRDLFFNVEMSANTPDVFTSTSRDAIIITYTHARPAELSLSPSPVIQEPFTKAR